MKKTNSKQLPFITFEIRTDDMRAIVTWQDTFSVSIEGPGNEASVSTVSSSYTFVGTYVGSLNSLAQMADATVEEMQYYDLLTRNCQVFCNKMLKRMDMREFEMTFEPDMISRTFDMITKDLTDLNQPTGQAAPPSFPMPLPSSSSNSELNDTGKPTGQSAPPACPMPLPSSSSNSESNANESEAKLPCSMPVKSSMFIHTAVHQ